MNVMPMNMFLSEDNIKRHLEHLRTYRLRYSILEKSFPDIKGKDIAGIVRMKIKREIKDEALSLLWYIKSHECFFDSFTDRQQKGGKLTKHYSSRDKFLYDLFVEAKEREYGFLFVYLDKYGIPRCRFSTATDGAFINYEPILALDLYEHAYFNDYGFNRDRYLRSALEYLDLERLNSDISS